ncbi:FUSC family protein [Alicyclobacillus fastidiosus]|uniref:Aromatic acid exporter family protein n=1 Tax=Alicyclobacillus fastidiosus TaxID=392011 RepID=A0ABV5ABX0_9BACL|nr:FUSC family protein [Alicyclobacillus fastidiosus]WEH07728.1 aromatic acid exporter family protein [Alicyclobacillus fastidiosus]
MNDKLSYKILLRFGFTLQVMKTAVASGISWVASSAISHNPYPYFAPMAAILTMQATISESIQKGVQRIIGIIGGVITGMLVVHWLHIDALSITLAILVGMAVSTALRFNAQITSQVAVTTLLILAFGRSPGYAVGRILDTLIGCATAILVNAIIIPPNPLPAAERRVSQVSKAAAFALQHLATAFEQNRLPDELSTVKQVVQQTLESFEAVRLVEQNLLFSPHLRTRRSRFEQLAKGINHLEHIAVQIRGIARGMMDLGTPTERPTYFTEAMRATSECISLYGETLSIPDGNLQQKLAVAVAQARTKQSLCLFQLQETKVLTQVRDMGAVLSDLSRILDEVSEKSVIMTGPEFQFVRS